jgi:hypothetical protein
LPHLLNNTLRRPMALLVMLAVLAGGISGPFLVVCRAPGGHYGTKILLVLDGETTEACCDCTGCFFPGDDGDGQGPTLDQVPCTQPCSDSALSQPFTVSHSRTFALASIEPAPVPALFAPLADRKGLRAAPGHEVPPYRLASVRVSVLLI